MRYFLCIPGCVVLLAVEPVPAQDHRQACASEWRSRRAADFSFEVPQAQYVNECVQRLQSERAAVKAQVGEPKQKHVPKRGVVSEQTDAGERHRKCGAEWRAAKEANKIAPGMTWPQFWTDCNRRLSITSTTSLQHSSDSQSAPSPLAELERFEISNRVDLRHLGADIQSNPFRFKDKIMSMRVKLEGMISENEAVVGWAWGFATHQVFLSKTPSTAFAGGEDYVLAFRMIGIRSGVPHAEYVASYPCRYGTPCYAVWEAQKGAAHQNLGPNLVDVRAIRR